VYAIAKERESKRWQATKGRMLAKVIVSQFESKGNGHFAIT
jgi:hypothetical protein